MEYPITITSKGVKLLNFNIVEELIFDDGTILKPITKVFVISKKAINDYRSERFTGLITRTIQIELEGTNFTDIANKLDSLIMKHYGEQQSLVILVTEELGRIYHHQRQKHGVHTATLPYIAIVACPIIESGRHTLGDISNNVRYFHNKFRVYE
jgi:hypothetical protein